jgi:hypothetical protein
LKVLNVLLYGWWLSNVSDYKKTGISVPGRGRESLSSPLRSDCIWGPSNFLNNEFPGAKRPETEPDHTSASRANVNKPRRFNSTAHIVFSLGRGG